MTSGFFGISVQGFCRLLTGAQWKNCSYASARITRGQVNRYTTLQSLLSCSVVLSLRCLRALPIAGDINTKRQSKNAPFSRGKERTVPASTIHSPTGIWLLGLVGNGVYFQNN